MNDREMLHRLERIEAVPYYPEADSFNLKDSLEALRRAIFAHPFVIASVMFLTLALVITYIAVWPPVYQADVVIMADSDKDNQRAAFYQEWAVFRRESLVDESTLMTSGPVLRRVIEDLDLKFEDVYHPFMSYVVYLWGESWLGKTYRKVKYSIVGEPQIPEGVTEEDIERGKVLVDFKQGVSVVPVGEANIGLLVVRGPTPRVAEIANKTMDVYLDERRQRYVREATSAYEALEVETDKALQELQDLETNLREFYQENGLLLSFAKDEIEVKKLEDLQAEVLSLTSLQAMLTDQYANVSKQLAAESDNLDEVQLFQDSVLEQKENLIQLQVNLSFMEQKFQPNAPELREIRQKITAIEKIIEDRESILDGQQIKSKSQNYEALRKRLGEIEIELAGVRAALKVKGAAGEEMSAMLADLPGKMTTNHALQRTRQMLERKYVALNEKKTLAAISMATAYTAPAAIRVIDYATPPDKKSWPNTKLLLLGALVFGLIIGIVCALCLELIFVRANRHRLAEAGSGGELFAIVGSDEKFLEQIFPRREPRLLPAPGQDSQG